MKHLLFLLGFGAITPFLSAQFAETIIGTTTYPLQSEGSIPRRIVLNTDGSVSTSWRMSSGAWNSWPDMGTGYNFYNGTNWLPLPALRIEGDRTKTNSLTVTGSGKEVVSAEYTNYTDNYVVMCPSFGLGTWTENSTLFPAMPLFNCAHKTPVVTTGGSNQQTIHHLAVTADVTAPFGNLMYHGQYGALLYSRSTNNGISSDFQNVIIPALDSSQSLGYRENCYAMDSRNNVVAIVAGGPGSDIILAKSTDNGSTWNQTVVEAFAIPLYDLMSMTTDTSGDSNADTVITNDGAFSILIDNNNLVHIWFGRSRMYNDLSSENYFIPARGLYYWNENMGSPVMIADVEDINGNLSFDATQWGTYSQSITSQASAGVDGDNHIFIVYSSVMEGTDDGTGSAYRGIYLLGSANSGVSWSLPYRICPSDDFSERVYPCMSRDVRNNRIRLTYEKDDFAGHGVGIGNPDVSNAGVIHHIIYTEIPTDSVGIVSTIGLETEQAKAIMVYPNPATGEVFVTNIPQQVERIVLYSLTGKRIGTPVTQISETAHILTAGLSNGLYILSFEGEGILYSTRFVVSH